MALLDEIITDQLENIHAVIVKMTPMRRLQAKEYMKRIIDEL